MCLTDLPHQVLEYAIDAFVETHVVGERHFRTFRRLVLRADVVRHTQVGLEEWNARAVFGFHAPPRAVALRPGRRSETDNAHETGFGEEFGDFGDATNVLLAVGARDPEVGAQTGANIFTVQHENLDVAFE